VEKHDANMDEIEHSEQLGSSGTLDRMRVNVFNGIIEDLKNYNAPVEEIKERYADLLAHSDAKEIASIKRHLKARGVSEGLLREIDELHLEIVKEALHRQGIRNADS